MALSIGEQVRTTTLVEAVKVTSNTPHFHGDLSNPVVIEFASKEILTLAKSFENYILRGEIR